LNTKYHERLPQHLGRQGNPAQTELGRMLVSTVQEVVGREDLAQDRIEVAEARWPYLRGLRCNGVQVRKWLVLCKPFMRLPAQTAPQVGFVEQIGLLAFCLSLLIVRRTG
jgi:hypothetical protein